MPKIRSTQFTVTGAGAFPWDMLRYDQAYPTDQGAQAFMHRESLFRHGKPSGANDPALNAEYDAWREEVRRPWSVQLHCPNSPTVDRWRSFGWSVAVERTF